MSALETLLAELEKRATHTTWAEQEVIIAKLIAALRFEMETTSMIAKVHLAKSFNPAAFIAERRAELSRILEGEG